MSKERLEEIKEHYNKHFHRYETFSTIENINWLIEQAERVQKLEEIKSDAIKQIDVIQERNKRLEERVQELEVQNQGLHIMYDVRLAKFDKLEQQNKRYREAIEFAKLKIKDFETDVKMIWKMAEDKIIKKDARQVLDDIADTLEALEGEE